MICEFGYSLSTVSPWAVLGVSGLDGELAASVPIEPAGTRVQGWALELLASGLRL